MRASRFASQRATDVDLITSSAAPLAGRAFVARFRPELPVIEDPNPNQRAVFVVDASSSGSEQRSRLAMEMMAGILSSDDAIREYAVLLFGRAGPLAARSRLATERRQRPRGNPRGKLERVFLEGATNLEAALDELDDRNAWHRGAEGASCFLLSDGELSWGQDSIAMLEKHRALQARPWFCYRFGDLAANIDLFAAMSRVSWRPRSPGARRGRDPPLPPRPTDCCR